MTTPTPLTDAEIDPTWKKWVGTHRPNYSFARAIEAEVNARWQKMLAGQEPVAYGIKANTGQIIDYLSADDSCYLSPYKPEDIVPLYRHPAPDHTALLQDVVKVIEENWSDIAIMLAGRTLELSDDGAECVRKQVDIYKRIKEALK